MTQLILSWNDIEHLVDKLAAQLKDKKYKAIYAVPRGGFIVAGMLAQRLPINYLFSTLHQNEADARAYYPYLVVDDVCDSGETLLRLRRRFPSGTLCTLHRKTNIIYVVCAEAVDKHTWIVYPWEKDLGGKVNGTEI